MKTVKSIIELLRYIKKVIIETNIVANSSLFDYQWYINNHHKVGYFKKIYLKYRLALHYYRKGVSEGINPSKIFYTKEYLLLNPDVAESDVHPLIHYERYGKYEGRAVSLSDIYDYCENDEVVSIEKSISKRKSYDKKIVTVLAMFSSSAKIEDYQLYLLKGLQEISDYIVIVSDNPVYKQELIKLNGLCNAYKFIRHGEYDFGSYKCGYNYLIENNILKENDNLLLINDSNYGPVHPFTNVIDDFKSKQCDFYGLSVGRNEHHISIQSFFYIFKSKVYNSMLFQEFILSVKKELTPAAVVCNYEFRLTKLLEDNGLPNGMTIEEFFYGYYLTEEKY